MADDLEHIEKELFDSLFKQYNNRLYGYILNITKSETVAEELTQEIFIKLWLSKELLKNVENMDGYIFTIARNKTFSYFRKAANDTAFLKELQGYMRNKASVNNVDDKLATITYDQLLGAALEQLSPQRRKVYELSRKEGMNMDQIADELGIAKNTVKNHLVESLRTIRQYFTEHGADTLILLLFFVR